MGGRAHCRAKALLHPKLAAQVARRRKAVYSHGYFRRVP